MSRTAYLHGYLSIPCSLHGILVSQVGRNMVLNQEAKRQALVDSLKHITPEMRRYLSDLKRWGKEELERPDFVWHILLQSFATWGTARGHTGLIENQDNYRRVTFEALSERDVQERLRVLEDVFLAAKVRYAVMKAKLMA